MILAATGHRPDKLGGYSAKIFNDLCSYAIKQLEILQPTKVISGMALGWDQAVAVAASTLDIPFIAAIPFGQESKWPHDSVLQYEGILELAAETVVVSPGGYAPSKLQKRNQWMVDHCDTLLALWNGTPGGTGNCVKYAINKRVHIVNCWADYLQSKSGD